MDGWKILGGVLGLFTTFTTVTTAIVVMNSRLIGVEKDVKNNEVQINELRDYTRRIYSGYPYSTNQDGGKQTTK